MGGDEVFGSYNKPNFVINHGKNSPSNGILGFRGFSAIE